MSEHSGRQRRLLASGDGDGGRLGAAEVARIASAMPTPGDPHDVLAGGGVLGGGGVYQIDDKLALVQAVGLSAPVVDDPYAFGQIAAADALVELYAAGATPKTALHIACFPGDEFELLGEIVRGGCERVEAAGAAAVGGHAVRDAQVRYGLSVSGMVDPGRMMGRAGARAGQRLVLTKGLGSGVVSMAVRAGRCPAETEAGAIGSMVRLNADAAQLAAGAGVRGAVAVAGFGLLGHAREVASASGVSMLLHAGALPILPGAIKLATKENRSRAGASNRQALERDVRIDAKVTPSRRELLHDPQTSGGLLLAVDAAQCEELVAKLHEAGDTAAAEVGEVVERGEAAVVVEG